MENLHCLFEIELPLEMWDEIFSYVQDLKTLGSLLKTSNNFKSLLATKTAAIRAGRGRSILLCQEAIRQEMTNAFLGQLMTVTRYASKKAIESALLSVQNYGQSIKRNQYSILTGTLFREEETKFRRIPLNVNPYQVTLRFRTEGWRRFRRNFDCEISMAILSKTLIDTAIIVSPKSDSELFPLLYAANIRNVVIVMYANTIDQESYETFVNQVKGSAALAQFDWPELDITFVPVEIDTDWNIALTQTRKAKVKDDGAHAWYTGPSLFDILTRPPKKTEPKPPRVIFNNFIKKATKGAKSTIKSLACSCKVVSGTIRVGDVLESGDQKPLKILSITNDKDNQVSYASVTDDVELLLQYNEQPAIRENQLLGRGVKKVKNIVARIIALDDQYSYTTAAVFQGREYEIVGCFGKIRTKVEQITKIDSKSLQVIKEDVKQIKNMEMAIVKISLLKPICMESIETYPELSQFVLDKYGYGTILSLEYA